MYLSSIDNLIIPTTLTCVKDIHTYVASVEGWNYEDFYLTCNGRNLVVNDQLSSTCVIRSNSRLLGGKGGFGSMLRAIGARIEKTTNHEACRDLSGRRMRDVNNEKQVTDWLKDKETKDDEREKKREAKLERILNPKHTYEDINYTSNLQKNATNIDEALKHAMKNRKETSGDKRKVNEDKDRRNGKKSKIAWIGMDDTLSDEDDDDNTEDKKDEELSMQDDMQPVKLTEDNCLNEMKSEGQTTSSAISIVSTDNEHSKNDKDTETTAETNDIKTVEVTDVSEKKNENRPTEPKQLDLSEYQSADQLEAVGLERLKSALMYHGLKCGGTLQDRAKRLFLTKSIPLNELDPSLFAKTSKKSKKNKK